MSGPSGRKIRRVAEHTSRKDLLNGRLERLLQRKYRAKGLRGRMQEDQAGALRSAYRIDNRKRRKRVVRRTWRGHGY